MPLKKKKEYVTMSFIIIILHYSRAVIHRCKLDNCIVRHIFVRSNRTGDVGTGYGERMRVWIKTEGNKRRWCFLCKFT